MDVRQEIAKHVDALPPHLQKQVLDFAASLNTATPAGEPGANLVQFASTLDRDSTVEMMKAIDEECERIDHRGW